MSAEIHLPYDYSTRKGVIYISWEEFGALTRQLAQGVADLGVNMVVGVTRSGLIPATAVTAALDCEMTPVRVTWREEGKVVRVTPMWKVDVSADVAGRVVAVIDEMASTGETLALVAARVRERGAAKVITASLCAHSWANPMPNVVGFVSDALVVYPWDMRSYRDGMWVENPDVVEAIAAQRKT